MATESVDDLIEELWSIVKKDSLASSRIGWAAEYTRDALKQLLDAYYTRECARKVLEGKVEIINRILGTNAEVHQDIPDWLISALFKIKEHYEAELRAAIKEVGGGEK